MGKGFPEKSGFDDEWRDEVEQVVEGWERERGEVKEEMREGSEEGEGGVRLDMELKEVEVERVVAVLRNGKAAGWDGVVGEILRNGGEWMTRSLWGLCRRVYEGERVPVEWMRVIKVPVQKKGRGELYEDYRGVSLLSVAGKVLAKVMEVRLRLYCEERGMLSDCQFGFRKGRACRDALMVLLDVIENRGEERVFAGFMDIAKAYPSVWRKGMWYKLGKLGVRGKMWRVIRSFYAKCEVGVRVGGGIDSWYEECVGLREGCVLSPLLFAIYINDLPEELERGGGGGGGGRGGGGG